MRSKPIAILGCVLLLGAVFIRGGVDLWLGGQAELTLPAPDRPWPVALRRLTVYLGSGLWWLRQGLTMSIIAGAILALWGGWPRKDRTEQS